MNSRHISHLILLTALGSAMPALAQTPADVRTGRKEVTPSYHYVHTSIPPEAYANRGDPESLISVSSDVVTVDLKSSASIEELSTAIGEDSTSTHAVLNCSLEDKLCMQAKNILHNRNIPTQSTHAGNSVTLIREQIISHDCENRYIDNSSNVYNLEPPTFGCSIKSNTVQMVTDKHQFTNPGLLDFQDGEKAAQTYDKYVNPPSDSSGQGGGSAAASSALIGSSGGR